MQVLAMIVFLPRTVELVNAS